MLNPLGNPLGNLVGSLMDNFTPKFVLILNADFNSIINLIAVGNWRQGGAGILIDHSWRNNFMV